MRENEKDMRRGRVSLVASQHHGWWLVACSASNDGDKGGKVSGLMGSWAWEGVGKKKEEKRKVRGGHHQSNWYRQWLDHQYSIDDESEESRDQ